MKKKAKVRYSNLLLQLVFFDLLSFCNIAILSCRRELW